MTTTLRYRRYGQVNTDAIEPSSERNAGNRLFEGEMLGGILKSCAFALVIAGGSAQKPLESVVNEEHPKQIALSDADLPQALLQFASHTHTHTYIYIWDNGSGYRGLRT